MPDPITCPHCREQLDIPAEYHGRPVRCASCQNVFVALTEDDVPVARPLSGRSSHADQPRPARRAADDHDDRPPRRSNVPVVLGLLFVVLTVGGCCGGLNLILLVQTTPTLTPYTSAEGKFKVEFPGENPTSGPTTNPADEKLPGVQVTADRPRAKEHYVVKRYPLEGEWRKLSADDALEKVALAELTALAAGPEERRETKIKHQGFPAIDLMANTGQWPAHQRTILRCILAGEWVYVVAVQVASADEQFAQFWWVRQYFLSFHITDPTAKPPTDDEPKKEKKQD